MGMLRRGAALIAATVAYANPNAPNLGPAGRARHALPAPA